MATTKVSALASKGTLTGSEEILINDSGTSKKSTVTAVRTGVTDATKLPLAGGTMTGNIVMSGSETVDGRDVSADGTQLDTNTSAIATKAPIASPTFTGTVAIPNIADLEAAVTANTAKVTNATHTGDVTGSTALTIAAGAVDIAMMSATGTASSSTYLRGDNAWAAVPSGNTTSYGLYEMANTIAANYSITSGNNALTAGPITINSGVSVTVPTGSTWVIA